jgi:hypothetical protein
MDSVEELARELAGREGFRWIEGMRLGDPGGTVISGPSPEGRPWRLERATDCDGNRVACECYAFAEFEFADLTHNATVGAIEGEIRRICHELEWEVIFRGAPGEGCIINFDDGRRVVRRFTVIEEPARGIVGAKALIFLLDRYRQKKS